MEKIQLRPVFQVFAHLSRTLGWMPWARARDLDLTMSVATTDIDRILAIGNKHPNGLSEEQKTKIFHEAGQNLAWIELYNRDDNFRSCAKISVQQLSGSNETNEQIEQKLFAFYQKLHEHDLFPQSFEGQRAAVRALDVLHPSIRSQAFAFLLAQKEWNKDTLQWLADTALVCAKSFQHLNNNPHSKLFNTLSSSSRFTPELIAVFFKEHLSVIDWEQMETSRGQSDIEPKSPLWHSAVIHLPDNLVQRMVEEVPGLAQKLKFTTMLAQRQNVSLELFELIASQKKMSVQRLANKSRDPAGIVQAVKNANVQVYFKEFMNSDPYTKSLLNYLVHKEIQATRTTILSAINRESAPPTSARRKM